MIEPQTTAVILLAAGRSSRFGPNDKLAQTWRGQPLGAHIAETLAEFPFAGRIAVTSGQGPDYAALGYEAVTNEAPDQGLSRSIRLGVERAGDVAAALIVLADMPRVTAAHIARLFEQSRGPESVVASSDGEHFMPPALFGAARLAALLDLTGDRGARDMLSGAHRVLADPDELIDVDNEDQLRDLRARFGA